MSRAKDRRPNLQITVPLPRLQNTEYNFIFQLPVTSYESSIDIRAKRRPETTWISGGMPNRFRLGHNLSQNLPYHRLHLVYNQPTALFFSLYD